MEASMQALRPALVEAQLRAFQAQGLAAFAITERATCLHEAGHAVVGMAIAGVAPRAMWIGARKRSTALAGTVLRVGETTYRKGTLFRRALDVRQAPPEDVIARAAHALAGAGAEMVFDGDDYRLGSSLDEMLEAEAALIGLGTMRLGMSDAAAPALIYTIRQVSLGILAANKKPVLGIADALQSRRKLGAGPLAKLLAAVKPPNGPPIGEFVLASAAKLIAIADKHAGGDVRKLMEQDFMDALRDGGRQ